MYEALVIFLALVVGVALQPLLKYLWEKFNDWVKDKEGRQRRGIISAVIAVVVCFGLIGWIARMSNQVENQRHAEVIDEIYKSTEIVLNAIHNK